MVCATSWLTEDNSTKGAKVHLVTCGFDRVVIGWNIVPSKDKESKDGQPKQKESGK